MRIVEPERLLSLLEASSNATPNAVMSTLMRALTLVGTRTLHWSDAESEARAAFESLLQSEVWARAVNSCEGVLPEKSNVKPATGFTKFRRLPEGIQLMVLSNLDVRELCAFRVVALATKRLVSACFATLTHLELRSHARSTRDIRKAWVPKWIVPRNVARSLLIQYPRIKTITWSGPENQLILPSQSQVENLRLESTGSSFRVISRTNPQFTWSQLLNLEIDKSDIDIFGDIHLMSNLQKLDAPSCSLYCNDVAKFCENIPASLKCLSLRLPNVQMGTQRRRGRLTNRFDDIAAQICQYSDSDHADDDSSYVFDSEDESFADSFDSASLHKLFSLAKNSLSLTVSESVCESPLPSVPATHDHPGLAHLTVTGSSPRVVSCLGVIGIMIWPHLKHFEFTCSGYKPHSLSRMTVSLCMPRLESLDFGLQRSGVRKLVMKDGKFIFPYLRKVGLCVSPHSEYNDWMKLQPLVRALTKMQCLHLSGSSFISSPSDGSVWESDDQFLGTDVHQFEATELIVEFETSWLLPSLFRHKFPFLRTLTLKTEPKTDFDYRQTVACEAGKFPRLLSAACPMLTCIQATGQYLLDDLLLDMFGVSFPSLKRVGRVDTDGVFRPVSLALSSCNSDFYDYLD
eukprot:523965_1